MVIVVGGEGKTICLLLPAFVRNELEIWTSQCNVKRYRAPRPNVSPKHKIMIIKTEEKKKKKRRRKKGKKEKKVCNNHQLDQISVKMIHLTLFSTTLLHAHTHGGGGGGGRGGRERERKRERILDNTPSSLFMQLLFQTTTKHVHVHACIH